MRKTIASALAAAGVFLGGAAFDGDTYGQNLVVNGDFEDVDISMSMGGFNAVLINDWTAPTGDGYAYSHDGSMNSDGMAIPDYANGGPLAGGGSFYFTSNANSPDNDADNKLSQDIDVTDHSALIDSGNAVYSLSAFFSSYSTFDDQLDFGTVQVDFVNRSGTLGTDSVTDTDITSWTQSSTTGMIPIGTETVRVFAWGTVGPNSPPEFGEDGYIDNIDFRIVPEPSSVFLIGLGLGGVGFLSFRRRND